MSNHESVWPRLRRHLTRVYLSIDPRSLGLFRIGLALLLFTDLLRRVPWIGTFYSNQGLLPNHTILWRPWHPRIFSLFFLASLPDEAALGFVLCGVAYFFLLIGYRTRLAHFLAALLVVSLHSRVMLVENSGSFTMGILVLWTLFLPLGRRFSVDALLASLRARRETTADAFAGRAPFGPERRPVVTLAMLAILVQLSVIYFFNLVHKSGPTWQGGTAVYYVLHQERIVTSLGLWVREHAPFPFTRALTYGTLVIEGLAPLLLLTPIATVWARRMAIVLLSSLHIGIALLINLGLFSATMVAFYPLLLCERDWALLGRVVRRRGRQRLVYFDAESGICFEIARVLVRLDGFERLRFVACDGPSDPAPGITRDMLARTIVVVDPASGRTWTRQDACAQILAALPGGSPLAWLIGMPGIHVIVGWAYDAFVARRARLSEWLGLAVHGASGRGSMTSRAASETSCARAWVRGELARLREALVAFLMFVAAAELLAANRVIPSWLQPTRPKWMVALVLYPRAFQGWSMFSPDAPTFDSMVYVDAVTVDGRHIDPLNLVASDRHEVPVSSIPARLGLNSFFCDYELRIQGAGTFHDPLRDWILRHHERTHHAEDEIVSFSAYVVRHNSPAPGDQGPNDVRVERFFEYRRPSAVAGH
jgi:predicted DCC family thiol-disulfide oxidoreductase YuxK